MSIELGRIGIWRHPSGLSPELAAEVEALGYGAIWVGGSPGGDLSVVESLLDSTDRIALATGIVNVPILLRYPIGLFSRRVAAKTIFNGNTIRFGSGSNDFLTNLTSIHLLYADSCSFGAATPRKPIAFCSYLTKFSNVHDDSIE